MAARIPSSNVAALVPTAVIGAIALASLDITALGWGMFATLGGVVFLIQWAFVWRRIGPTPFLWVIPTVAALLATCLDRLLWLYDLSGYRGPPPSSLWLLGVATGLATALVQWLILRAGTRLSLARLLPLAIAWPIAATTSAALMDYSVRITTRLNEPGLVALCVVPSPILSAVITGVATGFACRAALQSPSLSTAAA